MLSLINIYQQPRPSHCYYWPKNPLSGVFLVINKKSISFSEATVSLRHWFCWRWCSLSSHHSTGEVGENHGIRSQVWLPWFDVFALNEKFPKSPGFFSKMLLIPNICRLCRFPPFRLKVVPLIFGRMTRLLKHQTRNCCWFHFGR